MTVKKKIAEALSTAPKTSNNKLAKKFKVTSRYVQLIRRELGIPNADNRGRRPVNIIPVATSVDAVLEERGSRYGDYAKQAAVGQQLKGIVSVYLKTGDMSYEDYCVVNEALDMICTKMARILNGDPTYADNWVDIAGYAKLVVEHLEGKTR